MTESGAGPLLQVTDLKVHFPIRSGRLSWRTGGAVRAVDGVTFSVERGETVGLVGESGSGKSTIGRAVLRLQRATGGTVSFDGIDLGALDDEEMRRLRRRMQLIFQDPYASLDPRESVGQAIGEALDVHGLAPSRGARRERIRELLETVGLGPELADRFPHEFSGGQRQRIGIARALAVKPDFIVADEPISALDVSIQAQIINLLESLQEQYALTFLFIAHDLAVVRHISDRIAVMYLGRVVEVAERDELYEHPAHPYTRALLSAVPVPDPVVEASRERIILSGDVPSPSDPPSGCRFHTRCWLWEKLGRPEVCTEVDPQLTTLTAGHEAACHFAEGG